MVSEHAGTKTNLRVSERTHGAAALSIAAINIDSPKPHQSFAQGPSSASTTRTVPGPCVCLFLKKAYMYMGVCVCVHVRVHQEAARTQNGIGVDLFSLPQA